MSAEEHKKGDSTAVHKAQEAKALRKQLESTALGQQLEHLYEGLRQGPSRNTLLSAGAIVLIILLVVVARWFWVSSQEGESARWLRLDEALFPSQIEALARDKSLADSTQARVARILEARVKLTEGLRNLAADKEARKEVEEGTRLYEELIKESSSLVPLLRQEVLLGAAKGNEALGKRDQAKRYYEQLAQEFKDSALGKEARQQLERLQKDEKDLQQLDKLLAPKDS
jgi:hypothetical protein